MRARIDVSEIEAQTKIRAKYLRALENEEWGLLPGPDVRQELPAHLRPGARPRRQGAGRGVPPAPRAPQRGDARADRLDAAQRTRRARSAPGGPATLARLPHCGGRHRRGDRRAGRAAGHAAAARQSHHRTTASAATRSTTSGTRPTRGAHGRAPRRTVLDSWRSRCKPTAVVYVCLLGDGGRKLIPGVELQTGRKHAHLPRQALRDHARQQLGDNVHRRHPADGRRHRARRSATRSRKAHGRKTLASGTAADLQVSARSDERPRRHRRDRHRGADRPGQRPQRAMAGRTAARARRRPRLHDDRRRPSRGHARGARVHGRERHRADPHQRWPRTDSRRSHGRGRRRLPGREMVLDEALSGADRGRSCAR